MALAYADEPGAYHSGKVKVAVSKHILQISLLLTCLFGLSGCNPNSELDELVEQSPFKKHPKSDPDIRIVSCYYYPLELPGNVDVSALPFWSQFDPLTQPSDSQDNPSSQKSIGFTPDQIALWRANGLQIALAPLSAWPELRKSIIQADGVALPQTFTFIRNPSEFAELITYVLDRRATLFISGKKGVNKAYTLAEFDNGDCMFRLNCVPWQGDPEQKTLFIKIVPEFQRLQPDKKFIRDEFGNIRKATEYPKVIFDQLTFSGLVPEGHFICIAAASNKNSSDDLGQLFLTRKKGADNYQMILVLVPKVQSTAQIKAELEQ